jgi:hypothetical protein
MRIPLHSSEPALKIPSDYFRHRLMAPGRSFGLEFSDCILFLFRRSKGCPLQEYGIYLVCGLFRLPSPSSLRRRGKVIRICTSSLCIILIPRWSTDVLTELGHEYDFVLCANSRDNECCHSSFNGTNHHEFADRNRSKLSAQDSMPDCTTASIKRSSPSFFVWTYR